MAPAPVPVDICHLATEVDVGPTRSSYGFWFALGGATAAGPGIAALIIADYYTNLLPYFLACMHSEATPSTCRLAIGGAPPFQYVATLAPSHGAGTAGELPCIATGIYVQTSGGGKGSGSRIHIPGTPNEFTEDFAYLTAYGQQQLQFLATQLPIWVSSLSPSYGSFSTLGTLQTRRGGQRLSPPRFDPAILVRTTNRLETLARRQHQIGGFSPT